MDNLKFHLLKIAIDRYISVAEADHVPQEIKDKEKENLKSELERYRKARAQMSNVLWNIANKF